MKIFYQIIIFSIVSLNLAFTQALITNTHNNKILQDEYSSIQESQVKVNLFYSPYLEKYKTEESKLNLFKRFDYKQYLVLKPVFAIRHSSNGFNMFSTNLLGKSSATWITPGIVIKSTIPIMSDYTNVWIYSWMNFYKHSAHGFNNLQTEVDDLYPLFNYNPEYSVNFYTSTKNEGNGIDFDESQAGISILSSNFQFIFGQFQTNIGPFYKGNLSISKNAPSFPQFILKGNYKEKLYFSYLIGSLNSNISTKYTLLENIYNVTRNDLYHDEWILSEINENENTWYGAYSEIINNPDESSNIFERYVINHRLDILPNKKLRIGIYEQIIFGAKNPPLSYLIPINPFWSSQHAGNDLDNLQIGLDWEYYLNKYRIYGALMIDEWAPFDTFNDDERNWFAYQFGFTRVLNMLDKNVMFKIEYSKIDPRAYTHRFIINQPKHNGYNLGYWTGNDADDLFSNITLFLNDDSILKFEYQYSRIGDKNRRLDILEDQYDNNDIEFLGEDYTFIKTMALSYSIKLKYFVFMDVEFKNYSTNLYSQTEDYDDVKIAFRYNINY